MILLDTSDCYARWRRRRVADASPPVCLHDASPGRRDPTGTGPLRGKFRNDLDRRWAKLRNLAVEAIAKANILGLGQPTVETIAQFMRPAPAAQHAPLPGVDKVQAFQRWLDEALRQVVLGNDGAWTRQYVDQAWQQAQGQAGRIVGVRDAYDPDEARDPHGEWTSGSGLPMDETSRLARAKEQGFDTTQVLYHGTKSQLESFSLKKAGASDPGLVGRAVYLTPTPEQAGDFATSRHYGKGDAPSVLPIYARLKNPAIAENGRLLGKGLSELHPNGITNQSAAKLQSELKKRGFDGVVFKLNGEVSQVAVFDPKNVRSKFAAFHPDRMQSEKLSDAFSGDAGRLAVLRSVTVAELQGVMEAVSQQAVRAVAEGLMLRQRPAKIARAVAARVDVIGKQRGRLMANHMVVKTFAASTLDAYRTMGISKVGTVPERLPKVRQTVHGKTIADASVGWRATTSPKASTIFARQRSVPSGRVSYGKSFRAQAPSVGQLSSIFRAEKRLQALGEVDVLNGLDPCPVCQDISDNGPYDIDEAETLIPAHPNCECAFVPADDARFAPPERLFQE